MVVKKSYTCQKQLSSFRVFLAKLQIPKALEKSLPIDLFFFHKSLTIILQCMKVHYTQLNMPSLLFPFIIAKERKEGKRDEGG